MTFICGRAGVCALGAVIAKHTGDEKLLHYYLRQFKKVFCCICYLFLTLMILPYFQFIDEVQLFNCISYLCLTAFDLRTDQDTS